MTEEECKRKLGELGDYLYVLLEPDIKATREDERQLCIVLAIGCMDYNGGHSGGELKAFHHGIMTVVNVLRAKRDTQVAALETVGRKLLEEK